MSGNDDLAYGNYPGQKQSSGEEGSRSLLGSTLRTVRNKYDKYSSNPQQQQQQQNPQQQNQQQQYSGYPVSLSFIHNLLVTPKITSGF